jgi:hypothetical protein
MKTTVNIRDDIFRRAKARAALAGKPLSRYLEEALDRMLQEEEPDTGSWAEWAEALPPVSATAVEDLEAVLKAADFRGVDAEMWQ